MNFDKLVIARRAAYDQAIAGIRLMECPAAVPVLLSKPLEFGTYADARSQPDEVIEWLLRFAMIGMETACFAAIDRDEANNEEPP